MESISRMKQRIKWVRYSLAAMIFIFAIVFPGTSCVRAEDTDLQDLKITEAVADSDFSVYQIQSGSLENGGFTNTAEFADCGIDLDFRNLNGETEIRRKQETAAADLLTYIKNNSIAPVKTGTADSNGKLYFRGLEKGLYLVVGSDLTTETASYTQQPSLIYLPIYEEDKTIHNTIEIKSESEQIPTEPNQPKPQVPTPLKPVRLPQTGQLWWPVALLGGFGMILVAVGLKRRRKDSNLSDNI